MSLKERLRTALLSCYFNKLVHVNSPHKPCMENFMASRISRGNGLFPSQIHIDEQGVTVAKNGFIRMKTETIPFEKIAAVKIRCYFIGYSTITIERANATPICIEGFTKNEVRRMKQVILRAIARSSHLMHK